MWLNLEEQKEIQKAIVNQRPEDFGLEGCLWTLGHDLPVSCQTCLETGSFAHLRVKNRGISCNFAAGEEKKMRLFTGAMKLA